MALKCISYDNTASLLGGSRSRFVFHCDWSERLTQRGYLLGALDASDYSLQCQSVEIGYLKGDLFCGKAQLTCEFGPIARVASRVAGAGMRFRVVGNAEAITIKGGFKWASDNAAVTNKDVLPTLRVLQWKVQVYGAKSSFNLSHVSGYLGLINSDTFLGAAPGTLLFESIDANERTDDAGNPVWDVSYNMVFRPRGWNNFYRDDPPAAAGWDGLKDGSGDPPYASTAFSGL